MFDAVKEALDQISLAIHPRREREDALAVGFGRNIGPYFVAFCGLADGIGVVSLVRKQRAAFLDTSHEAFSLRAVRNLAARQAKIDRTAFRINSCVDFACEAATGTSHATIVGIPLFPVAPCW